MRAAWERFRVWLAAFLERDKARASQREEEAGWP